MTDREVERTPTRAELMQLAVKNGMAELRVSLPGRIEAYDVDEQKADIKILLKRPRVAGDGTVLEAESFPILHDIPIAFDRGGAGSGNFFTSYPMAVGDKVNLTFSDYSLGQYMDKSGEETDPIDFRNHHLGDAVARPGLYPKKLSLKEAHPDNAVFGRDEGMQLHITPSDTAEFRIGGIADLAVAIAENLKIYLDTDIALWDKTHTHGSGVGPTGPPIEAASYPVYDDDITSNNLKVKGN